MCICVIKDYLHNESLPDWIVIHVKHLNNLEPYRKSVPSCVSCLAFQKQNKTKKHLELLLT